MISSFLVTLTLYGLVGDYSSGSYPVLGMNCIRRFVRIGHVYLTYVAAFVLVSYVYVGIGH